MYRLLIRPFLFLLSAEKAHHTAFALTKTLLLPAAACKKIGGNPSNYKWYFEGMPIYTSHFKLGKTLRLINLVHIGIFENFLKKMIKDNTSGLVSQKSFTLI